MGSPARTPDGQVSENNSSFDVSRRRFLAASAGASVAAVAPATSSVAADSDDTITIVHDTHFHGRFRDTDANDKNIQRYYTVVEELLDDYDNAAFVGIGDDFGPSALGMEYEGAHMVEALNEMDLTVNGVGNHEYDYGPERAAELLEDSEFPWVVANLLTEDDEPVPGTERWVTEEVGDYTVGFFGLVSENFRNIVAEVPEDWQILGNVEAAEEAVSALEDDGADVIVCAAHISTGAHHRVAENVDGLDAIVGSHSGVVLEEPEEIEGTINSEFGDEFDHIGVISLDEDGDLVDWERIDLLAEGMDPAPEVDEYDEISVRYVEDIEKHEGLDELYEEYQVALDERLEQPFFHSSTPINWSFDNYAVETGGGNLIGDAIRSIEEIVEPDVDIGVTNAGGIRAATTYGPGLIPGAAVMETLPFPNEILVIEVKGDDLVNYLDDVQRPHPDDTFGTQPAIQISGVSFEWWGHDGESRIENVFVGGEPVDPDETYVMAGPDFELNRNEYLDTEDGLIADTGQILGPFVLNTLEEWESVGPTRENRMLRFDEEVDPGDFEVNTDSIDISFDVPPGADEILTDSIRAVIRTGDDLEAEEASVDGGVVTASFDHDSLIALVDGVDDPVLRLFGSYEADQDWWDYDFDIPTSDGYDYLKVKAPVEGKEIKELPTLPERIEALRQERDELQSELDDLKDDLDEKDGVIDSQQSTIDDKDDEINSLEDQIESLNEDIDELETALDEAQADDGDDEDDGLPGFGALAALAGAAGGAYAYSRFGNTDGESAD